MYKTTRDRRSVKSRPNRKSVRLHAPFGAGLLAWTPYDGRKPYDQADLDWAAQAFAAEADWPDAIYDAMAQERAWEEMYEAGLSMSDRCSLCGLAGPISNGLCAGCADATGEDIDRGHCSVCGVLAYLEDDACCVACSLHLSDLSHSGNRGY